MFEFVAPEECRKRTYIDPFASPFQHDGKANSDSESPEIELVEGGRVDYGNSPNLVTIATPPLVSSPIIAVDAAAPVPVVPILDAALATVSLNASPLGIPLPEVVQNAPATVMAVPHSRTTSSEQDETLFMGGGEGDGWIEELPWEGGHICDAKVTSVLESQTAGTASTTTHTRTSPLPARTPLDPVILNNVRIPRPTPVHLSVFSPQYLQGAPRPKIQLSDVAWPGASAPAHGLVLPKFDGCPPMMSIAYRWLMTNTETWGNMWHETIVSFIDFMKLARFKVSLFASYCLSRLIYVI